ncbi:oxidoreductase [Streptomyces mirabilis]|uniref:oxidoreductase n=1 Tax=Streptomyces mirabilis TaxID=68239 RepID=UPI0033D491B7
MSIGFDPEFAQVFAPMAEAMAHATPPAVGDVPARRAMWEPIIGAASAAQPIPTDVTTAEHHATADDGTQITMRWYAKTGAAAGPAVLFFHGGGWRHRVRRRGDPRRQRLLRPPFLSSNANERTGRYGGSAVHRIRFATEATSAVAAAIGADRTGLRISPHNSYNDITEHDMHDVATRRCSTPSTRSASPTCTSSMAPTRDSCSTYADSGPRH